MHRPGLTLLLGLACVASTAATPNDPSPSPAAEGPRCQERSPSTANARLVDSEDVDAVVFARWRALRQQAARAMQVRAFAPGADPEPLTARRPGGWLERQETLRSEAETRAAERLSNGMVRMRLDGAFLEPLVATQDADGSIRVSHAPVGPEEH